MPNIDIFPTKLSKMFVLGEKCPFLVMLYSFGKKGRFMQKVLGFGK